MTTIVSASQGHHQFSTKLMKVKKVQTLVGHAIWDPVWFTVIKFLVGLGSTY
jgi:hypothetical protein